MILAGNKQYGPFEITDLSLPDAKQLVTLPYAAVVGSQILAIASDNYAGRVTGVTFSIPLIEVVYRGYVQGQPYDISRAQISSLTGPFRFIFPAEMMFDQLEIAGRNMSGGRRGSPTADGFVIPDFSSAAGFSLTLDVTIQPVQRNVIGAGTTAFGGGL